MTYTEYTWIFVLATGFSFLSAFGIGANDVANSFASSVGARAITIGQACLIASVCEFSGAVGLGAAVTSTIKSGITNVKYFKDTPDLFLYGMFCVLIAAAFWDNLACQLELPVSTTHTTVGAIVGMTMVLRGGGAVIWSQRKDEFPYFTGMASIFGSWVASPIMAGVTVFIFFGLVRFFVLRSEHSFDRAFWLLPIFGGLTFFVITVFIIQTGNTTAAWSTVPETRILWIGAILGVATAVFILVAVMPVLRGWVLQEEARREQEKDTEAKGEEIPKGLEDVARVEQSGWWNSSMVKFNDFKENTTAGRVIFLNPIAKIVSAGVNENIHEAVKNDESVGEVWDHAEVFDWRTEALFRYLQVFSAMVMSFAHGANDVANAVGPYAAIHYTYYNRAVPSSKSPVPKWIYVMGGVGFVLGLATFGHHIMRVLGVKVAKMTNARGFCAELSTAMVVVTASRYGLPISTTQTICGAILAIGLMEGAKGVNWKVVIKTFGGWVLTLIVAGLVSAGFTAFGAFSPRKITADEIVAIRKELLSQIKNMESQLNSTNLSSATFDSALNNSLVAIVKNWTKFNSTPDGYTYPLGLLGLQKSTLAVFNSTYAVEAA